MLALPGAVTHLVFNEFELDVQGLRLLRKGKPVHVEARALDMLCYLATHPDRLVSKEELISEVWHARALSPGVLANAATKLRRALGQKAGEKAPLETVHGRGYRFHVPPPPKALSVPETTPLPNVERWVGRKKVLEKLETALTRTAAGQGQLLLVVGEAGIGKTRTLSELAQRARARGFSVWEAAAYDGGGAPPYWPWVEVLRAARHQLTDLRFHQHLPARCEALTRLIPELCPPATTAPNEETLRFRLFDEVAHFLASTSLELPRLIVLEDLHWADVGTVELLLHSAQALTKRPLLVAASFREHEVSGRAQLAAALSRLSRHARRIPLRPLSLAEISDLVRAALGSDAVEAGYPAVLAARTQGNPFFIMQMLELASQHGKPLDAAALQQIEPPPAVRHIIERRLERLSEEGRAILATAALIGHEFDAELLAKLQGCPLPELLDMLESARAAGMVAHRAGPARRYAFVHALVQEALLERLEPSETCALHGRLAHVLAAQADASDAARLYEIAHHALLAAPFELTFCLDHCRRAAALARAAAGFSSAAELLLRAEGKLLHEDASPRVLCELLLSAGVDQFFAGDMEGAWHTLVRGAARAEALPDGAELLARFVFRLVDCAEVEVGDESFVRALLERALARVEPSSDVRPALLAHRAELAFDLPFEARIALLDEADGLAAARAIPELTLEVAHCRVNLRDPTRPGHSLGAVKRLRELLAKTPSEQRGRRSSVWEFSADLTEYICVLGAGDLARADKIAARARIADPASRPVGLQVVHELMFAGRALGDGRFDDLEQHIAKLRALSTRIAGGLANVWLAYTVWLADARGTLPTLAALLPTAQRAPRKSRNLAGVVAAFAWALLKAGRLDEARQTLHQVSELDLARMPTQHGDLGMLCDLAEVYTTLGDLAAAERLHGQLLPHASANAVGPCLDYRGSVEHYLALLADALGHRDEALTRIARAHAVNKSLGMPIHTARTEALRQRILAAAPG